MNGIRLVPAIDHFETFGKFAEEYKLGKGDILVTNRWMYQPLVEPLGLGLPVIFQEEFGEGEPSDEMMDAMKREMDKYEFSRIIAFGGGTILDCCKVLSLKIPDKVADLYTGDVTPERITKLVLVPTTCGTGSEVTNVAVAALPSFGIKKGIAHEQLYADQAVLIPEALSGLPDGVFAASSIDALIHAAEAFVSPKASPYTDLLAREAIRMIMSGYMTIVGRGGNTRENRQDLLSDFIIAANYAGIAFGNAGVGAVHALSYAVGGAFHTSHGESNFICFTEVFRAYKEKSAQASENDSLKNREYILDPESNKLTALENMFADILECEPANTFEALDQLLENFIHKYPLREKGMTEDQIKSFAKSTIDNQQRLLANNYVPLSEKDIARIFAKLF